MTGVCEERRGTARRKRGRQMDEGSDPKYKGESATRRNGEPVSQHGGCAAEEGKEERGRCGRHEDRGSRGTPGYSRARDAEHTRACQRR